MEKKRLITGTGSFINVYDENLYYVDKTLFIKEFLESNSMVSLITRPRRFGKTLNLTMLLEARENPRIVANLMGHKKISTTVDTQNGHAKKTTQIGGFINIKSIAL